MEIVYKCDVKGCSSTSGEMMHLARVYEKKATKKGGSSRALWLCDACVERLFGGEQNERERGFISGN